MSTGVSHYEYFGGCINNLGTIDRISYSNLNSLKLGVFIKFNWGPLLFPLAYM